VAEYTRAEAKAGIVIVVAVILFFALLVFVSDYSQFVSPKRSVEVVFEGVQGLKTKDPVRYAGMRVGKIATMTVTAAGDVNAVGASDDDPNRLPLANRQVVVVSFKLAKEFEVRKDDDITINKTLTGGLTLEIVPNGEQDVWNPGDGPIRGNEPPGLAHYANRGAKLIDNIEATLQMLKAKGGRVLDSADKLGKRFNDIFDDEQEEQLRNLIANIDKTSKSLVVTSERIQTMIEKEGEGTKTLKDLRNTIAQVDRLLQDSRKDVLEVVKNLRESSRKFSGLTEEAGGTVASVNKILDRNRDNIEDTSGKMKSMADNLQAWSEDVRRHPWVLLRKPDDDEIAEKEISFAARQIKQGLTRADRTVEALLEVSKAKSLSEDEGVRLTNELKQILEQVRKLQKKLERKL